MSVFRYVKVWLRNVGECVCQMAYGLQLAILNQSAVFFGHGDAVGVSPTAFGFFLLLRNLVHALFEGNPERQSFEHSLLLSAIKCRICRV